jgi:hypothetical protein
MDYKEFFNWIQEEAFKEANAGADPVELMEKLLHSQFQEKIDGLQEVRRGVLPDQILGLSIHDVELNGTELIKNFYNSAGPIYRDSQKELSAIVEALPTYSHAIIFIYQLLIQLRERKEAERKAKINWNL